MPETMYERITSMPKDEMKTFIYMVYLAGARDGKLYLCDSPELSYFGSCDFLDLPHNVLMPNNNVNDLIDTWEILI